MKTEVKFEAEIVHQTDDFIISIRRTPYVIENGEKKVTGPSKNLGLVPGEFDKVARFAPELLPYFNKIWKPDVVRAFRNQQALIEAKLDGKNPQNIPEARELKRREIDLDCELTIFNGFYVPELDKHFTLDTYDQINMSGLSIMASMVPYIPFDYGIDDDCRVYSAEEFGIITISATMFAVYNRTYRKQLRRMVNDAKSIDEVMSIKWGQTQLTGRYLDRMLEVMSTFEPLIMGPQLAMIPVEDGALKFPGEKVPMKESGILEAKLQEDIGLSMVYDLGSAAMAKTDLTPMIKGELNKIAVANIEDNPMLERIQAMSISPNQVMMKGV